MRQYLCAFFCANDYADLRGEVGRQASFSSSMRLALADCGAYDDRWIPLRACASLWSQSLAGLAIPGLAHSLNSPPPMLGNSLLPYFENEARAA